MDTDGSLTIASYSGVVQCTKLQKVRITPKDEFEDGHSEEPVGNAPNLESPESWESSAITDAGLKHIQCVRKLRYLSLSKCDGVGRDAIHASLLETLRLMDLSLRFRARDIGGLANLKNLESLKLSAKIDAESSNLICEELEKLGDLRLVDCGRLIHVGEWNSVRPKISKSGRSSVSTPANGLRPSAS